MTGDRIVVGCDRCRAVHLAPPGSEGAVCPGCGAGAVSVAEPRRAVEPEVVVPFATTEEEVRRQLQAFVAPVWFPTRELDAAVLASRLRRVWWPRWLVDADAAGAWEAEVGFDYPVESSQEVLEGGSWTTRRVTETRQRWEPRGGRVVRRYDNVPVAALRGWDTLEARLGAMPLSPASPGSAAALGEGWVRLPDLGEAEQWPAAVEGLRARVGEDCRAAAGAQHLRDLRLDLRADAPHWTWLLTPGFATWYADDDGVRHLLLVHGGTGRVAGPRMASPARGRTVGLGLIAAATALGAAGACAGLLGVVLWILLPVAAVVLLLALVVGCVAFWPFVGPAGWNRAQRAEAWPTE